MRAVVWEAVFWAKVRKVDIRGAGGLSGGESRKHAGRELDAHRRPQAGRGRAAEASRARRGNETWMAAREKAGGARGSSATWAVWSAQAAHTCTQLRRGHALSHEFRSHAFPTAGRNLARAFGNRRPLLDVIQHSDCLSARFLPRSRPPRLQSHPALSIDRVLVADGGVPERPCALHPPASSTTQSAAQKIRGNPRHPSRCWLFSFC